MTTDLEFDRQHIWHPYTGMNRPDPVYTVTGARGVRLEVEGFGDVVDGMSSWWTAIHGYNHPVLNSAVHEQLERKAHVMFGGLTHEPAITLSRLLVELTPAPLQHVFLADSGSVSVEVALKMAVQYQQAGGAKGKRKFLALRGGYHGDTLGAMSVCDPDGGLHAHFADYVPKHYFAPRPSSPPDRAPTEADMAPYRMIFEAHAEELAGFILEPIVQGAGGMWFYHPEYLRAFRALCDEFDVLLILDEIATGFGRTGTLFAAEHGGIAPDILCVGKALTGGMMTLAACLCTSHIAETVSNGFPGVLMHGPTFMANPLACASAVASIRLLIQSNWQGQVAHIEQRLQAGLAPLLHNERVKDVRTLGAIGVVEMHEAVEVPRAQKAALEAGVWLRPFRNLIYTMPPYITSDTELDELLTGIHAAVLQA
ncbi:MAG: adenosylmethionine--8-amino-7-oxononanoate transaminase [Flavobacteriales bacterium]